MKIRIQHDGNASTYRTKITNAETGEELEHVGRVELDFHASSGPNLAKITVYHPIL